MIWNQRKRIDFAILSVGLCSLAMGVLLNVTALVALGCVALLVMLLRAARWMVRHKRHLNLHPERAAITLTGDRPRPAPCHNVDDLVEQMLATGRYSLLLRPQVISELSGEQIARAHAALDAAMAIVPAGPVVIGPSLLDTATEHDPFGGGTLVDIEALYLDRYPVTNREYQTFLDSGGYEQMGLWDPEVWPGVLDFVDRTGRPGPRYWEHGRHAAGHEDLPVVGVCWYEAVAYARWAGKRLPSDPEWVKAGAWPVAVPGKPPAQRKFPWGDSMDRRKANLWGSGPGQLVAVQDFPDGVTVGGVYQLIGNTWEWMNGNFGDWDVTRRVETQGPSKSLRGGAFNTYCDTQATCQFESGDSPLARRDNIGFRCALSLCDVVDSTQYNSAESADAEDHEVTLPAPASRANSSATALSEETAP